MLKLVGIEKDHHPKVDPSNTCCPRSRLRSLPRQAAYLQTDATPTPEMLAHAATGVLLATTRCAVRELPMSGRPAEHQSKPACHRRPLVWRDEPRY